MLVGTQDQTFFPKPIEEKFYYVKAMGFDSFEIDGQVLLQERACGQNLRPNRSGGSLCMLTLKN